MAAVRRDAHERLRHEARERLHLAADLAADLAVGREVVGGLLGAVEVEVQLELARSVLVVALDHVEAERLRVLDHLVDDRLELGELVDVVAVGLREALDRRACRRRSASATSSRARCRRAGAGPSPPRTRPRMRWRLPRQSEVRNDAGVLRSSRLRKSVHQTRATLRIPGERHERLGLGHADQLGRLRAVPDVLAVTIDEEVRGRAVDELEALPAIVSQCVAGTPLPMIRPVTETNW